MTQDDETIRVYDAKAMDYANLVSKPKPDAELQAFMDALPEGGRVLDLGCGPGNSARFMAAAGFKVDAIDASSEMIALASKTPGVTAWQATFDHMPTDRIYNGVWANFSLLHAARARIPAHLKQIHDILLPGGTFHIGVKLGTTEARDGIGRLYTYFTETELDTLLSNAGFTIAAKTYGNEPGLSGEPADWICVRAHA